MEGSELLAKSFPGGASAPTQVVVPDASKVGAVTQALEGADGVAAVQPAQKGEGGTILAVTLDQDPYSTEAQDLISGVRAAAQRAGGDGVLVGGDTAIQYDLAKANARDLNLIIPIVLLVVFVILIGLLRALVLPLVLIGTVVISFAAALGISSVLWTEVFGFAGADRSIVLFAFVFLVALGIDYNIFLASRIREEALRYGTREGILRGLGATGSVITAAGIVLAGTFLVLATTRWCSSSRSGPRSPSAWCSTRSSSAPSSPPRSPWISTARSGRRGRAGSDQRRGRGALGTGSRHGVVAQRRLRPRTRTISRGPAPAGPRPFSPKAAAISGRPSSQEVLSRWTHHRPRRSIPSRASATAPEQGESEGGAPERVGAIADEGTSRANRLSSGGGTTLAPAETLAPAQTSPGEG